MTQYKHFYCNAQSSEMQQNTKNFGKINCQIYSFFHKSKRSTNHTIIKEHTPQIISEVRRIYQRWPSPILPSIAQIGANNIFLYYTF